MFGRRRFLAISAVAISTPAWGRAQTLSWRGAALGAAASIRLSGQGWASTADTFAEVEAELSRLESIFSLYRSDSALSVLNRTGRLRRPPADLLEVLSLCKVLHKATGGAFDPTVQPLWRALALAEGHPEPQDTEAAARLVGWDGVAFDVARIAYARPGMAMTLNGIAQGYITDRIATLLRARGFGDVLIDIGEIAALGLRDGAPWRAAIAAPDGRILRHITLRDRCLATSARMGTLLDSAGHVGHILDPRPERPTRVRRIVAVSADRAAVADGLSTGCCLLGRRAVDAAVAAFAGAKLEILI